MIKALRAAEPVLRKNRYIAEAEMAKGALGRADALRKEIKKMVGSRARKEQSFEELMALAQTNRRSQFYGPLAHMLARLLDT